MDRFSIPWQYSCSTPFKLYHQRTIRCTLLRSLHKYFSCSLIQFLKSLCKPVSNQARRVSSAICTCTLGLTTLTNLKNVIEKAAKVLCRFRKGEITVLKYSAECLTVYLTRMPAFNYNKILVRYG